MKNLIVVIALVIGAINLISNIAEKHDSTHEAFFKENTTPTYYEEPVRTYGEFQNSRVQNNYSPIDTRITSDRKVDVVILKSNDEYSAGVYMPESFNYEELESLNNLKVRESEELSYDSWEENYKNEVSSSRIDWNYTTNERVVSPTYVSQTYSYTPSSSSYSNNINPEHVQVRGYYRKNGTYVEPYVRTAPNSTTTDNFSHYGNLNPYTGEIGTKLK